MEKLLDQTFAALAHPARRAILTRLARGSASATELGEPLEMSQPAVSKHLKVLEEAGLVTMTRDAQWRRRSLETDSLMTAIEWLDRLRSEWEHRLDRLERYISNQQGENHD